MRSSKTFAVLAVSILLLPGLSYAQGTISAGQDVKVPAAQVGSIASGQDVELAGTRVSGGVMGMLRRAARSCWKIARAFATLPVAEMPC